MSAHPAPLLQASRVGLTLRASLCFVAGARTRASIAVSLFDHSNPYKRTQAQLSAGSTAAAYGPSSSSLLGPLNLHMYLDQALLPGVLAPRRPFDVGACIEEDELEHETSSQPSLSTYEPAMLNTPGDGTHSPASLCHGLVPTARSLPCGHTRLPGVMAHPATYPHCPSTQAPFLLSQEQAWCCGLGGQCLCLCLPCPSSRRHYVPCFGQLGPVTPWLPMCEALWLVQTEGQEQQRVSCGGVVGAVVPAALPGMLGLGQAAQSLTAQGAGPPCALGSAQCLLLHLQHHWVTALGYFVACGFKVAQIAVWHSHGLV